MSPARASTRPSPPAPARTGQGQPARKAAARLTTKQAACGARYQLPWPRFPRRGQRLPSLPPAAGSRQPHQLEALRRWGVAYLTDPTADGAMNHEFDLHYVEGIDALHDAEFGLVVDGTPTTLRFSRGHLDQAAGAPADPILTVRTSSAFMDRWAAGTASWDDGRLSGEVTLDGQVRHWDTWLAATGYLLAYHPEPGHA